MTRTCSAQNRKHSANQKMVAGWRAFSILTLLCVILPPPLSAGTAYIIASSTGLLVVDTATTGIRGWIPTNMDVKAAVAHPDGTRLYVAHRDPGIISVIDTASYVMSATIPFRYPASLAIHPSGKFLYVNCQQPDSYTTGMTAIIDTRNNSVIATLNMPADSSAAHPPLPHPDGSVVYILVNSGELWFVDAATHRIKASLPMPSPFDMALSPDGKRLYVVSRGDVVVVDTATNTVMNTIRVNGAGNIALSASGTFLYATVKTSAMLPDAFLATIDTRANSVAAMMPLGFNFPHAIVTHPSKPLVYVAGQTGEYCPGQFMCLRWADMVVLDSENNKVTTTKAIPPNCPPQFDPGGRLLFAGGTVLDADTHAWVASIPGMMLTFGPDPPIATGGQRYYEILSGNGILAESRIGLPGDRPAPADYDGDGRTDAAVWRPREPNDQGIWHILNSSDGRETVQQWGASALGDIPVPADYDGDGRADIAVWRSEDGVWYIRRSSDGQIVSRQWGGIGDAPVPADYDGDRRADIAIYRPIDRTWFIINSSTGEVTTREWGWLADLPVPADYDGDGKTDIAVWRPMSGEWFITSSATGSQKSEVWGGYGDVPVPADFDGDKVSDLAIWRPGTGEWFIRNSRFGSVTQQIWGARGDRPFRADFDGDGLADLVVYRP